MMRKKEIIPFIRPLPLSVKDPQRLFKHANFLIDPVLLTIPDNPRFCLNSGKQFRLMDADTIEGMKASDKTYRKLIREIDNSGPTGIGYILTALPEVVPIGVAAADKVLSAWKSKFPMDKYSDAEDEVERQSEIYFHERWLDNIDAFLDQCVWDALPEEVRQIPALEKQLQESEEEYNSSEEEDESVEAELQQLREQLHSACAVRDELNLIEIKANALMQAQIKVPIQIADRKKWSLLLNFDQDDPTHVLTEEELTALVSEAVDAFVQRRYVKLTKEEDGPLKKHLTARRELQDEKRSNAEGSLRTQAPEKGEAHQLSLSEVRDPINRTLFIDVSKSTDGNKFRDIIIGACLWAVETGPLEARLTLPLIIKEFVSQRVETDPTYTKKAKDLFQQFRRNDVLLPTAQIEALAGFGLQALKISTSKEGLANFGLLKRSRSEHHVSELEHPNKTRVVEPWSP